MKLKKCKRGHNKLHFPIDVEIMKDGTLVVKHTEMTSQELVREYLLGAWYYILNFQREPKNTIRSKID